MATGFAAQADAAADSSFVLRVELAIALAAPLIYNEATMLAANLQSGVAVTSIPLTAALGAAIAAGTVVLVGGETAVVSAAGAAQGATAIPVLPFTPARVHAAGEVVSPPTVVGHAARAGLGTAVLNAPATYAPRFAVALASQGLDNGSTDAAISTGVAVVWSATAGA